MNNIKTIESNLNDLVRVCKEVKKRAEAGTLPADGKITALTNEQAQTLLFEKLTSFEKPDCSDLGCIRFQLDKLLPKDGSKIKNELITRAFNEKMLRPNVPSLMDAFTPEELKAWAISELANKTLPGYKFLKTTQKILENSIKALEDHTGICSRYDAGNELIKQGTKEVIGAITYKTPLTSSYLLPLSAIPKSAPLHSTTYENSTIKLPRQPEIKTTPLQPLNLSETKDTSKEITTQTTASSLIDNWRGSVNVSLLPLKPKHIEASALVAINNVTIGAGIDVSLKKPLSSRFVINLPITASPIPLCVNINGQLNRLHKMQFKLEIPLSPISKLVSVVGVKCPSSLRIVSVKVKNVIKNIKKVFKHKKKHKNNSDPSTTIKHKVSYVNCLKNTPVSPELMAACKKIADDLIKMDGETQKLEHEINIAIEGVKDLKDELEDLFTQQAALESDFEKIQTAFNAQKEQLASLPSLQAQITKNQQQLNTITSVVQANMTPERIIQIRNKFSPEEAVKIAVQAKAIASLNT